MDAHDFEDKLFDFLCDESGKMQVGKFKKVIYFYIFLILSLSVL